MKGNSKLSKMPKEKTKSKAARYAEYKQLEEEKLVDGVKKLVILVNILLGKLKNISVLFFSLLHKLPSLSHCRSVAFGK